jgi:hypothetical protein
MGHTNREKKRRARGSHREDDATRTGAAEVETGGDVGGEIGDSSELGSE